jgi:hypothetical protein
MGFMSSGARAMEGIGGRLSAGVAGAGRSMISTARAQGAARNGHSGTSS